MEEIVFLREQLQSQRGMLSKAIENLISKMTELEGNVQKLTNRNRELKSITYQLFHSMRGPLTTLMGLLELMRLENEDESMQFLLENAEKTIKKLDTFSTDLVKKVEILLTEETLEHVKTQDLLADVKAEFDKTVGEKSHLLKINFSSNLDSISIQRKMLIQILINLLLNIWQHAYPENEVEKEVNITIKSKPDRIIFCVSDKGLGMCEAVKEKSTQIFYTANNLLKGNGLGLYVVKVLIDERGGQLKIMSQLNKGTSVLFSLPN